MSLRSLKHVPLFAGLNEEELKEIRTIAAAMQVAKRKILFSDCEESNGLYVVLSGKVKLYKVSPEGKEQIIHVISPPDTFAEASVFLKGSHPFYAETLSDCQLLFLPESEISLQIDQEEFSPQRQYDHYSLELCEEVCVSYRRSLPERSSLPHRKISA